MTIYFPVIELVDRYCIAKLKFDKTRQNRAELDFYQDQLAHYDLKQIQSDLNELYDVHVVIWDLESQLKSGKEHELALEEIGRRAIMIRNWNQKRIALKNTMADKLGQSWLHEIKQNHLSE